MDLNVFVNPARLAGLSDALIDEAGKANELVEAWRASEPTATASPASRGRATGVVLGKSKTPTL